MKRIIGIGLLALAALATGGAQAQMNALPQARHILVYGQAQARAIPDRFRIELNFHVVDPKADVARTKVEAMMQDTLRKLRAAGVADADMVATSLRIEPREEYDATERKQVFRGIGVRRSITATFAEQERLRRFLGTLETSEQLQVSGVTTTLSNEQALKRALRLKAIEATRAKAAVIAESYGVRVTGLYSVSDTAPQFEYGISEGQWPVLYEWRGGEGGGGALDMITVTGSRIGSPAAIPAPPPESFHSGHVTFSDTVYAVFLIGD